MSYDFDSNCMDIKKVNKVYSDTKMVVIRNALDKKKIEKLRKKAQKEFEYLNSIKDSLSDSDKNTLFRCEMPILDENKSLRTSKEIFEIYSESKIPELLNILNNDECLWHYPAQFRKLLLKQEHGLLPYHQDYFYNSRYENITICFTSLQECGVNSPSIEFIDSVTDEKLSHEGNEIWEFGLSDKVMAPILKTSTKQVIELNQGDVVLFDAYKIHRTHFTKSMQEERYSVDVRAIPKRFISDLDYKKRKYIDIKSVKFKGLNNEQ
ncbi:MAG: hypothetical protein GQ570_09750 [Helicobacteraceae bacterium]|nr:hypothetical protein [Helicobacteraceae bacterium]